MSCFKKMWQSNWERQFQILVPIFTCKNAGTHKYTINIFTNKIKNILSYNLTYHLIKKFNWNFNSQYFIYLITFQASFIVYQFGFTTRTYIFQICDSKLRKICLKCNFYINLQHLEISLNIFYITNISF